MVMEVCGGVNDMDDVNDATGDAARGCEVNHVHVY